MDEYVSITVVSNPGESTEAFKTRLSGFWSHMLRDFKSDFEKVYAETVAFEQDADRWTRQYLAQEDVIDLLEQEFRSAGIAHRPIDRDDVYSKYEATPPDWMWIEH